MDKRAKDSDPSIELSTSEREKEQESSNEDKKEIMLFSPFSQLPNELYWSIFERVDPSEELIKCCDVSPLWRDLILAQTPLLMHDKVLTNVFPYLEHLDFLSCRHVCRDWMKIVGKEFEKESVCFDEDSAFKFDFYTRYEDSFWNERNIENPNAGQIVDPSRYRHVRFVVDQDSDEVELDCVLHFEDFVNSLRTIGTHVWFLEVEVCCEVRTGLSTIRALRDVLSLVPNLQTLMAILVIDDEHDEEDNNEIVEFLAENPLPNLPHLATILRLDEMPNPMFTHLLNRYANQLTHLDRVWIPQLNELVPLGLTLVESLSVLVFERDHNVHFENLPTILDGCECKLKHLGVNIYLPTWMNVRDDHAQNMVAFINSCQAFLESLEIRINHLEPNLNPDTLRALHLPNVRKIKLYFSVVDSFNFLINLSPILEHVELAYSYSNALGELQLGGEVNKHNYTSLYQSQIWRMIPTIKTIWIKDSDSGTPYADPSKKRKWNYSRNVWNHMQENHNQMRDLALADAEE